MVDSVKWPWQYNFPPFFTLQQHNETRARQILIWKNLVLEYCKANKLCFIDVREAKTLPLFSNTVINRKLDAEFVLAILSDLQRTQNASPVDKQRNRWEIYWHTLEEWGSKLCAHVNEKGATNSVLTIYELVQGEDAEGEEFYGVHEEIVIKALKLLEDQGKCELILFEDRHGVKFF